LVIDQFTFLDGFIGVSSAQPALFYDHPVASYCHRFGVPSRNGLLDQNSSGCIPAAECPNSFHGK